MRALLLFTLSVVAVACSTAPAGRGRGGQGGDSCETSPDPACANAISHAIVPMLRAAHVPIRIAPRAEICRRMAIDLVGRIPTPDEAAACDDQTPEEMADAFMHLPEYVTTQARPWGEAFGYDVNFRNWYGDVVDLNAITEQLYDESSPLAYRDFVAAAVVHPAIYAVHQEDDWSATIFNVFLGRAARPDEIAGMRPLAAIWNSRFFCDGALWFYANQEGEGSTFCSSEGYPAFEWAADFCLCAPGEVSAVGCKSDVLGKMVDFGTEGCVRASEPESEGNMVRLGTLSVGQHAQCPDGSQRPECKDQGFNVDDENDIFTPTGPITPLAAPTSAQTARLRQLGDALAERPDFWEAAADREIQRFIGWWKDGTRRPDFDLPEVRTIVADVLRNVGDLRSIHKLLVTSLLYVAPAQPPDGVDDPPLWSMGPTKFLGAETWLDSVAVAAVGRPVGFCDWRFVGAGLVDYTGQEVPIVDPRLVRQVETPLAAQGFTRTGYDAAAQQLGGCSTDGVRPRFSSVGVTYAQHEIGRTLAAYGPLVLPPDFTDDRSDEALGRAADHVGLRFLSRAITDDERATFVSDMQACLAAQDGCATTESAVRWLALRILDSGLFALY